MDRLHDPVLDGPDKQAKPDAPTSVRQFVTLGSLALLASFLHFVKLRNAATMPTAVLVSFIAAGLGFLGLIRYPSPSMSRGAPVAFVVAALVVARF
jgi:hypothetical protein